MSSNSNFSGNSNFNISIIGPLKGLNICDISGSRIVSKYHTIFPQISSETGGKAFALAQVLKFRVFI